MYYVCFVQDADSVVNKYNRMYPAKDMMFKTFSLYLVDDDTETPYPIQSWIRVAVCPSQVADGKILIYGRDSKLPYDVFYVNLPEGAYVTNVFLPVCNGLPAEVTIDGNLPKRQSVISNNPFTDIIHSNSYRSHVINKYFRQPGGNWRNFNERDYYTIGMNCGGAGVQYIDSDHKISGYIPDSGQSSTYFLMHIVNGAVAEATGFRDGVEYYADRYDYHTAGNVTIYALPEYTTSVMLPDKLDSSTKCCLIGMLPDGGTLASDIINGVKPARVPESQDNNAQEFRNLVMRELDDSRSLQELAEMFKGLADKYPTALVDKDKPLATALRVASAVADKL